MPRTAGSPVSLVLLLVSALAGCRHEREPPPEPRPEPAAEVASPWFTVPPDSLLYGATAVENLRVVPVELELRGVPRGWDGMRIAVLSDLNLGLWADNARVAEAAVQRAVDLNPDLIVLLGDFVAVGENLGELSRALTPLQGRAALAVLGERDVRTDTLAAGVARTLAGRGVTVLRNQVVAFARGRDTAYIAGLAPYAVPYTGAVHAELFAELPEAAATPLLLAHLPTVLPSLPPGRFPAVLSGHVFCGQIDVPGSPRLAALADETLAGARVPRTNRLYRSSGSTLFVSCGTGYSFVPARLGAPPEVALVTLLRMPEPAPATPDTVAAAASP